MPVKGTAQPVPADFLTIAPGKTYKEIARHYGVSSTLIDRWYKRIGATHVVQSSGNTPRPVPDDFATWAAIEGNEALRARYSVGANTIIRWRKEAGGIQAPRPPAANRRPIPAGFAQIAKTKTLSMLCVYFGAGEVAVQRWCQEVGVKPLPSQRRGAAKSAAHFGQRKLYTIDTRDSGPASRAQSFLQRYGPVYRCDQRGQASQRGAFFYCWGAILEPDALIARAERKGWQRDEWQRLAA